LKQLIKDFTAKLSDINKILDPKIIDVNLEEKNDKI
jgi:hypothetical protein